MLNFLFQDWHEVRVYRSSVTISFAFSDGKLPLAKMCCLRGKTRDKYVCAVRWSLSYLFTRWSNLVGIYIIYINLEINIKINKSSVERGNFVCQYHWHVLRAIPVRWTPLLYQRSGEKIIRELKQSRFWDADGNRKWVIFTFNLPSHNYIHIANYLYSYRDE